MQIIDFHTHLYPPKIAERTLSYIKEASGMDHYTDGTVDGLIDSMKRSGITGSIVLPVVTSPKQFDHINEYALEVSKREGVLSFGGIHPACEDLVGHVHWLRDMGFKGIKLHPDYQHTDLLDPGYLTIMKECAREDLIVVLHAGFDPFSPDHIHCTPDMIKQLRYEIPDLKLVAAHVGSNEMLDQVEEKLAGEGIYFDLSRIPADKLHQVKRVIYKNGPDMCLFASDSPWMDVKENLDIFMKLGLGQEDNEKILYKNALELLKVNSL